MCKIQNLRPPEVETYAQIAVFEFVKLLSGISITWLE